MSELHFAARFWLLLLWLVACDGTAPHITDSGGRADAATPAVDAGAGDGGPLDAGPCPTPIERDCVLGECDELEIAGETIVPRGFFHGLADPVLRADPGVPDRVWLGYSFPSLLPTSEGLDVPAPALHLARSDDGGRSWALVGQVHVPVLTVPPEPAPRMEGYAAHETFNFVYADVDGTSGWYGARLTYWVPPGTAHRPDPRSFAIAVTRAASPADLGTSPTSRLGTSYAHPGVVDVDLNELEAGLRRCALYNEPALHFEASTATLYLALQCQVYRGDAPIDEEQSVELFRAPAVADVAALAWSHAGTLADAAVARELGGAKVQQTEIARGSDGQLLVIMNPSRWDPDTRVEVHDGCRVLELEALDPPRLRRACGQLVVRRRILASDQDLGTSSCGYDAASATGVVLSRRTDPITRPGSGWSMHATRELP